MSTVSKAKATKATKAMKFSKVRVTPAVAAKYLGINLPNNRSRSDSHMDKMARDMENGNFDPLPGDSLKFRASDGKLCDGQHRLTSLIRAGVTITFEVVHNFPDERIKFLDVGKSRSLGDVIRISEIAESYTSGIASSINWGLKYDSDRWANFYPSHSQAFEWLEANPTLPEYVRMAYTNKFGRWTKQVVAITAFLMDRATGDDTGMNFWEVYASKKNLSDAQAVLARWAENNLGGPNRIKTEIQIGVAIKAMNAHVLEEDIKVVSFRFSGPRAERFPRILNGEFEFMDAVPDLIPEEWAEPADPNVEVTSGA